MSGIPVFFLHFINKGNRLFFGFALAYGGNETGLFLHNFTFTTLQ